MSPDPDDATVNFTVKELLGNLQKELVSGLARLEVAMSGKADKADVARMEARLDAHGKALDQHRTEINELQIQAREEDRARRAADSANAWWLSRFAKVGGFLLGLALGTAAVVDVLHSIL